MISQAVAQRIAEDVGKIARIEGKRPIYIGFNDLKYFPPFPFPSIGTYRPFSYKLVDELLCDSSGFGADDELALTAGQLLQKLESLILHSGRKLYFAIIEEGEFQVVVGVFHRTYEKKGRI
jgi:hypothetical protein